MPRDGRVTELQVRKRQRLAQGSFLLVSARLAQARLISRPEGIYLQLNEQANDVRVLVDDGDVEGVVAFICDAVEYIRDFLG